MSCNSITRCHFHGRVHEAERPGHHRGGETEEREGPWRGSGRRGGEVKRPIAPALAAVQGALAAATLAWPYRLGRILQSHGVHENGRLPEWPILGCDSQMLATPRKGRALGGWRGAGKAIPNGAPPDWQPDVYLPRLKSACLNLSNWRESSGFARHGRPRLAASRGPP